MSVPSWRRCFVPATILLIVAAAWVDAPAQKEAEPQPKVLRVLFIGNSQIYFNDLPRTVEALAESGPQAQPRIKASQLTPGGASLESLWNKGTEKSSARAKIAEEKWDYVVLQEHFNAKAESFNQYAPLFHELIEKNGSKTVFFCTASISTLYPKGFLQMHDMQVAMGKKLNVPVATAGKAWLSYWGDDPTPEQRLALYDADKAHPGKKGSYLYACSLYATLTGHTPVGLTHRVPKQPEATIAPEEAKKFQEAAWRLYQEMNPKKNANP
jgi:hypothetical protein